METIDAIPLENVGATQVRRVEREPIRWEWIFIAGMWAVAAILTFMLGKDIVQSSGETLTRIVNIISFALLAFGITSALYAFDRNDGYVELSVSSPGSGVSTSFEFPESEYEFAAKVNEAIADVVS